MVYKVDRLTRSLADFAKLIEIFDGHAASFVSVTQAFNTTTSMGRLTLNILLSFAQFEREEDAPWAEWRGIYGNQQPHKLSPGELARLLEPFQIRPRTIRIFAAASGKPTVKGYYRSQFEAAWRSYCKDNVTPSQPKNIRYLRRV